ncbi:MAG: BREX-2 system adenine-specific DNA-methyltransferase PglX [Tessaracoccus sp.]
MISPAALVDDLKKQVLALEADLRQRIALPEFDQEWRREHTSATSGDRTAATYTAWADDRITQAAVSWVLTTVFVRFCEDNALLSPVWISGPAERRQEALDAQLAYFRENPEHTDREWVEQAIDHLATTSATAGLVDDQAMLHTVSPSGQAITRLLEFWRRRDENGALLHDFTDPNLDTRFLGDLYQDLSEHAKKTYALLQTPEFVEEFILDRTLDSGLNDRPLDGFKLIDPACGSGHFLLGAFHRILGRWEKEAPALGARQRVNLALASVWGVDINPFAAAIAVFRLTAAALKAVGQTSLEKSPSFAINVLAGDSLWFSHEQDSLISHDSDFAYSTEHKADLVRALTRGQYDAVVANPPYITVKDKALNTGYRQRYNHLKGKYQLTAPFMELLFKLAKRGDGTTQAGWVGQITSNAFMKREFGVPVVEDLLANLDLRLVIDTSGAYIPGHGTPTVIIVGRNQNLASDRVRAVLGKQGEPGRPSNPASAQVWSSILNTVDLPDSETDWVSTTDLARTSLARHPWSLAGGGVSALLPLLQASASYLSDRATSIGITSFTLEDDAYLAPRASLRTRAMNSHLIRWMILGDEIRDWIESPDTAAIFPYTEDLHPIDPASEAGVLKRLWPVRTNLRNNIMFGGRTKVETGLLWTEYGRLTTSKLRIPLSITFAFVATHNHFVLDRGGKVFNRSAPVIKLPAEATEDDHLQLLGVLNSSTACFWLKQNSYPKGGDPVGKDGARVSQQPWSDRYEFTGTTLKDFPLPKKLPLARGRVLDNLAQELSGAQVGLMIESAPPSPDLLGRAEAQQASLRGRMIAHQEELDWEVYASYGLLDEVLVYAGEPPEVRLGERAFEIVLARKIAAGEDDTTWFSRHGSTPITQIPAHWPADYRDLVQRRIDAIEQVDAMRLLEAPEYKRRWATEPFAEQANKALRGWLLNRLEDRALWFTSQGQVRPRSIGQLADILGRDEEFVSVVDLWQGHRDSDLVSALTSLVDHEAVPYLAAHRLKDSGLRKFAEWQRTWQLQRKEDASEHVGTIPVPPKYGSADFRKPAYWANRGKLDVPKERFILYPGGGRETDPTPLLGWAGWDHAQQSLALATILHERITDGAAENTLIPLVAGLAELQPWVEQWHSAIDPTFGLSPAEFSRGQMRDHLAALGATVDDLAAWRPPAPTRGRRAASAKKEAAR